MQLITYTNREINGYWDGGSKNQFTWTLGKIQTDEKGTFQRIHGWEANYWFHVAKGKTDKLTLSNALRHLKTNAKKGGYDITSAYSLTN